MSVILSEAWLNSLLAMKMCVYVHTLFIFLHGVTHGNYAYFRKLIKATLTFLAFHTAL